MHILWADCRDGAALLKVAGAGHEALFDHHHSQPGATKAARAGTPGGRATTLAGTTSGGSLHDSEAVWTARRLTPCPSFLGLPAVRAETGQPRRKPETLYAPLRSVICVPFLEQADDGGHSSSESGNVTG